MVSPVEEMLNLYLSKNPARFHMPGHKGLLDPMDVTELSATDDLLSPSGPLAAAQAQAAEAFGAEATFFCTCGATAGVLAMLLALPQGSRVALFRNCHKSAANGLALGRHRPLWVDETSVWETLKDQRPAALLVTSPDYFGSCLDLEALSAACKAAGALLLVDQAHGAHLGLSDALPPSAAQWADMWVGSAHKTLLCPNQGAYLNLGKGEFSQKPSCRELKEALFLIHTTSPSFPLLMALDKAWRTALTWDYAAHIQRLKRVKEKIRALGLLPVKNDDETRLVVDVSPVCSGFSAASQLEEKGVYLEMADGKRIVAITAPIDPEDWYDRLLSGLSALKAGKPFAQPPLPPLPPVRMTPALARFSEKEQIPLKEALGRVAAVPVGAYPPGCAVVAAGEEFTQECVGFLLSQGALFGADGGLVTIVKGV